MFLVNQAMIDVPVGTAALIVVLGMAVVFFGLILLMYVTKITGKIMQSREKKADVHTEAPAAVPAPAKAAAPGSAGEIKLHDVPDKTAAMLMAIVADKLGKPLNELRFISIREIKDRRIKGSVSKWKRSQFVSLRRSICRGRCLEIPIANLPKFDIIKQKTRKGLLP